MLSADEIRVLDANSAFFGVPSSVLMEHAGKHVAAVVKPLLAGKDAKVVVLCGLGNNGGDGLVAARYLASECQVLVYLVGFEEDIHTSIARNNLVRLQHTTAKVVTAKEKPTLKDVFAGCTVVVDALLGIGLSGSLRSPYKELVETVNGLDEVVRVAVDVPTGLGTDLLVDAQYTVTFHAMKEGMSEDSCGKIVVVDIGIPDRASEEVGPGELSVYYPRSSVSSHKRDNGVVLIVGGGPYTGAPALAGMAAHRTGCDLVHIATPSRSADVIAGYSPNFIVHRLSSDVVSSDDIEVLHGLLEQCTCMVIGPGIGSSKDSVEAVQDLIKLGVSMKKPMVVDADGIAPLSQICDEIRDSSMVVTPHAGEFMKLTGNKVPVEVADRKNVVREWTQKLGITMLLKGVPDIISDGRHVKINTTHNAGMTVGGTGDVLAGIVGALVSKNVKSYDAACMGAFLNGAAGNIVFQEKSFGLAASDIIDALPLVLKKYL